MYTILIRFNKISIILSTLFSLTFLYTIISFSASTDDIEIERRQMLQEDQNRLYEAQQQSQRESEIKNAQIRRAGFLAMSDDLLLYEDAVAFCRKHGGRLPRINNSNFWDGDNPPQRGIKIDGFGYGHRPFEKTGLPAKIANQYLKGNEIRFWTDTRTRTRHDGIQPWFVFISGYPKRIELYLDTMQKSAVAACVPN